MTCKKEYLEVGDKLHVTSVGYGTTSFEITRVTKMLAFCKPSSGREYPFKRLISSDMSHPNRSHTVRYRVERKNDL